MRILVFLFIVNCFIVIGCQKKGIPVISDRTPMRNTDTTMLTADTISGRMVLMRRCDRCHGLPDAIQYTADRWESIVAVMAPKARLNRQQTFDVLSYLKAHARK